MKLVKYLSVVIFLLPLMASETTGIHNEFFGIDQVATDIPARLARKYHRDAARLALRINQSGEDLRYQEIMIPDEKIDAIYNVLKGIYVKDETAKSIARCNVHTLPNPSIDRLIIVYERNVSWAEPLRNGISETESETINQLLDQFDLIIDKHVQWSDHTDAITIRSKKPLNMAALANEFYNVEGVESIDLGLPEFSGNDIEMRKTMSGWEVSFVLRFGARIKGAGKEHFWRYEVNQQANQVQLLEEGGDPLPEYMRCHFEPETPFALHRI